MPEGRREEYGEKREMPGAEPAEGGDDQVDAPGADKRTGEGEERNPHPGGNALEREKARKKDIGDYDV